MIDASKLPRIPNQLQSSSETLEASAIDGNRVPKESHETLVEPVDMVLEGGRYYARKIGGKEAQ